MKRLFKTILATLLIISTVTVSGLAVFAYSEVPETIKIGLFYGSSAKDSCVISAGGGIAISVVGDNARYSLTQDESVDEITVKKDTLYHVILPDTYDNYQSAWEKQAALKAEGYSAYTAYKNGIFYVSAGAFSEKEQANAIAAELSAEVKLPSDKCVLAYVNDAIWISVEDDVLYFTAGSIDGNIAIDGKEYRGEIQIMRRDTGDMTVVNLVGFDDYLCGVVPREVSASWNYEAVKAQSVVSRTFAMMDLNKYQKYGFNLDNTTNSQAYAGVSIEHPASNKAIAETHGEVVLYDGKPADVYFFASSGGKTGTANDAWGGENKPYLISVDDPYENADEASYSKWEMTFTVAELKEKLASRDVNIGDITDIKVEYSDSGRAIKTIFVGTEGEKEYMRENIRWVLGLYSTAFDVLRNGEQPSGVSVCALDKYNTFTQIDINADTQLISKNGTAGAGGAISILSADGMTTLESAKSSATGDFVFSGRGWGHGVGMSQWGAKGMADSGYNYKEILEYYFVGTQIG